MQTCRKFNLTASYAGNYPPNDFVKFDPKRKRFTGHFSSLILNDYFLRRKHETQEELLKYCTFKSFSEEGTLLPNGTFTGAIGAVVARSADVTMRFQNQFIEEGFVDFSNVVFSEDLLIGHYIDEKTKSSPTINLDAIRVILVPSVWFLLEYMAMFALSLAFVYLLGRFLDKKPSLVPHFVHSLFAKNDSSPFTNCSPLRLFLIANLLFVFIVQQILSNNVNTEKVIVSDELILDSLEKIARTEKVFCVPLKEDISMVYRYNRLYRFKEGSFYRLTYEKLAAQRQPCCLSEHMFNMQVIAAKDFFMMHGGSFMILFKIFNPLFRKHIFIGDRPILSSIIVHYLSKSIEKRTGNGFNRQATIYLESGFKIHAYRNFERMTDKLFPPIRSTYRNAREYIKQHTLMSDVEMKDFTFVYLLFIAGSLLLTAFTLRHLSATSFRNRLFSIFNKTHLQA